MQIRLERIKVKGEELKKYLGFTTFGKELQEIILYLVKEGLLKCSAKKKPSPRNTLEWIGSQTTLVSVLKVTFKDLHKVLLEEYENWITVKLLTNVRRVLDFCAYFVEFSTNC